MSRLLPVLLLLAATQSGCAARYLHSVTDGPGDLTLIKTQDTKFYGVWATSKNVFWECHQAGEARLKCVKVCDVIDDQGDKLACPSTGGFGQGAAGL